MQREHYPLIGWIYTLFGASEESIRDALKSVVHLVHYEKAKSVYLYNALESIEVECEFDKECVAIKLDCFEDKTVQCNECITLMFPSIDTVLDNEAFSSFDEKRLEKNMWTI